MTRLPTTDWPVDARPAVRVAGLFSLHAEDFGYEYRGPHHALHLHEYAGRLRLGGHEFAIEPGTVTLSPAGLPSSYDLPRPGVHWCVHFAPCALRPRGPRVRLPWVRPLGPLQSEAARRMAQVCRLRHATGPRPAVTAAAASLALQEMLVWLGLLDDAGRQTVPPTGDPIERLMEDVDRRLHDPLSAGELATRAGWSQNYLARQFRRRTGMTVPRYVLGRRIAAARLLLETTDLPVKQVAVRVGLADPHYFNKQFRTATGLSPTAYRAKRAGV